MIDIIKSMLFGLLFIAALAFLGSQFALSILEAM